MSSTKYGGSREEQRLYLLGLGNREDFKMYIFPNDETFLGNKYLRNK